MRPFWGAFFDSGRGKREFLKTLIFADSIALFDVFLSEGVENHLKNGPETTSSENLVPRASWKPFGGHFGSQNRSGRGSENELDFESIFKRPPGGTASSGAGSPRLQPDRRGGVGEGYPY